MLKKLKKAFTITELVIVIAVIAILAAVLIPTFSNVISNSKKSAALQTCKNALTNYLAEVTTDEDPSNDNATGIVFVSNGYAYVYMNSALQYMGETEDFARMNTDGSFNNANLDGFTFPDGEKGAANNALRIAYAYGSETETETTSIALADLGKSGEKQAENLYFYSIKVNDTQYAGYFTLEETSPKYQTESATYSRQARIAPMKEGHYTLTWT